MAWNSYAEVNWIPCEHNIRLKALGKNPLGLIKILSLPQHRHELLLRYADQRPLVECLANDPHLHIRHDSEAADVDLEGPEVQGMPIGVDLG